MMAFTSPHPSFRHYEDPELDEEGVVIHVFTNILPFVMSVMSIANEVEAHFTLRRRCFAPTLNANGYKMQSPCA